MSYLAFRLERPPRLDPPAPPGLDFRFLASARDGLRLRRTLVERFGRRGSAKALAKLATRSRFLYCVVRDGAIVHHGWLLTSSSALYDVARGDVVIGPIRTAPDERGRGAATFGLMRAIDAMAARGHGVFLIHTTPDNAASLRVIEKCGFAPG